MKINKEKLILFFILLLAIFLRFYQLGQVPPSPDWDEAALGYNAYSILKTGRDEYGAKLPLILRSFDDYKPAIYVYLLILPIKFLGMDLWVVRLPAAVIGVLAVWLTYLLVKELFSETSWSGFLALVVAFLLAISPWHLQFSRAAFETGVGMFVNILIAILFLKGLRKPCLLLLAAFFAGLNIYIYQAEKIFTPLLVLVLVLIWRQKLFSLPRRWLILAVMIGLLTLVPFAKLALTTPEVFTRAKGTSFASDQTVFLSRTVQKLVRDKEHNDYLGLVLDNRRLTYLISFVSGWLSHFDLNWLFLFGDDTRHHAPGMGLLYLVELPFFLWGIYALVFELKDKKTKALLLTWFLLAPIPAAFSSGVPHAIRSLRFLPIIQIIVGLGVIHFWSWLKSKSAWLKFSLIMGLSAAFVFNFAYYLSQYLIQLNYFDSSFWQYGYQEAVEIVKNIESKYDQIIVSNEPHLDQSYMFFLYYLQYDPVVYQRQGGTISGGFREDRNSFSKYVFRPIKWDKEERSGQILYIGRPDDFPGDKSVVKTVDFLNGQPAIKIVEGQ